MMTASFWIIAVVIFIVTLIISEIVISPFAYPYLKITMNPAQECASSQEACIDHFLKDENNFKILEENHKYLEDWKQDCESRIQESKFSSRRREQYERCVDDENEFRFYFASQPNDARRYYFGCPRRAGKKADVFSCDFRYLKYRYEMIKELSDQNL